MSPGSEFPLLMNYQLSYFPPSWDFLFFEIPRWLTKLASWLASHLEHISLFPSTNEHSQSFIWSNTSTSTSCLECHLRIYVTCSLFLFSKPKFCFPRFFVWFLLLTIQIWPTVTGSQISCDQKLSSKANWQTLCSFHQLQFIYKVLLLNLWLTEKYRRVHCSTLWLTFTVEDYNFWKCLSSLAYFHGWGLTIQKLRISGQLSLLNFLVSR